MKRLQWTTAEEFIVTDEHFVFTMVLYVLVLLIFVNQIVFYSVVLGSAASLVFLFINALFVGHAFFRKESALVRFMLGGMILLVVLGFVGWIVLIAYNLDAVMSTIVLSILAGFCSLLNRLKQGLEGEAA